MTIDIPIKYEDAIYAIRELYDVHGVGGYGHLVFDDGNYDCVEACLKDAKEGNFVSHYDDLEEHDITQKASIKALEACLNFTEDEVEFCVIIYRAWRDEFIFVSI